MPASPPLPPPRIMLLLALLLMLACGVAAWRITAQPAGGGGNEVLVVDPGVPVSGLSDAPPGAGPQTQAPAPMATVTVHVVGPVARPGVVVLPEGARVADAIQASGGLRSGASASLNLARPLVDGEQIDVAAPAGDPAGPAAAASGPPARLDLNRATAEQLQGLPGVGPVLAERILAYRQEHGRFASVEQLEEVPGIGSSRMADLADLVTVGQG